MKKPNLKQFLAILALLFIGFQLNAQQRRTARLISPVVQEDNTVIFRLLAPQATEVTLSGNWMPSSGNQVELTKGDSGVWSFQTTKLPP